MLVAAPQSTVPPDEVSIWVMLLVTAGGLALIFALSCAAWILIMTEKRPGGNEK